MIDGSRLSPWEQIYTFVARDGRNIHIHAPRLRLHCLAMQYDVVLVPVDYKLARSFLRTNTVDPRRVVTMTPEAAFEPIILCKTEAFGTNDPIIPDVLMVDGHHRFTRAAMDGLKTIRAYLLELSQWQPFTVVNLPDTTQKRLTAEPIIPHSYWNTSP